MKSNFKFLSAKVEYCLDNFPATRDSDITLFNTLLKQFSRYSESVKVIDGKDYIALESLYELPRFDDITRIRRKFNEKGKYLSTNLEVIQSRQKKEEIYRAELGYNPELRAIRDEAY